MSKSEIPLEFDPSRHIYTVAGIEVVSVTRVLSRLGLSPTYPDTPEAEAKRNFGTSVHSWTVEVDQVEATSIPPDHKFPSEDICKCGDAWSQFKKDYNVQILHTELPVYCHSKEYAGTIDRVAMIDGKLTIIDIKTGNPGRVAGLQLAGYAHAYFEDQGEMPRRLIAVQVLSTGQYKVSEYDLTLHSRVWSAAMTVYAWKELAA